MTLATWRALTRLQSSSRLAGTTGTRQKDLGTASGVSRYGPGTYGCLLGAKKAGGHAAGTRVQIAIYK
jgi:hypothetical protein